MENLIISASPQQDFTGSVAREKGALFVGKRDFTKRTEISFVLAGFPGKKLSKRACDEHMSLLNKILRVGTPNIRKLNGRIDFLDHFLQ